MLEAEETMRGPAAHLIITTHTTSEAHMIRRHVCYPRSNRRPSDNWTNATSWSCPLGHYTAKNRCWPSHSSSFMSHKLIFGPLAVAVLTVWSPLPWKRFACKPGTTMEEPGQGSSYRHHGRAERLMRMLTEQEEKKKNERPSERLYESNSPTGCLPLAIAVGRVSSSGSLRCYWPNVWLWYLVPLASVSIISNIIIINARVCACPYRELPHALGNCGVSDEVTEVFWILVVSNPQKLATQNWIPLNEHNPVTCV